MIVPEAMALPTRKAMTHAKTNHIFKSLGLDPEGAQLAKRFEEVMSESESDRDSAFMYSRADPISSSNAVAGAFSSLVGTLDGHRAGEGSDSASCTPEHTKFNDLEFKHGILQEYPKIPGEEHRNKLLDKVRRDALRRNLYRVMQKGERLDTVTSTVDVASLRFYVCVEPDGMWTRAYKAIQGLGGSVYGASSSLIFGTHNDTDRTEGRDNQGASFKPDTRLQNMEDILMAPGPLAPLESRIFAGRVDDAKRIGAAARTSSYPTQGATGGSKKRLVLDGVRQNIENYENPKVWEETDEDEDKDVLAGLLSEWTNFPPQEEPPKGQ